MNLRIIYPTDDGVAIIIPAAECGLTIEEVAKKDVPAGVAYKIVNDDEVPSDRTFRNALKYDLTVDMPKAQGITKERLRAERAPLLTALDVQYQRATEDGRDTTIIISEKQRLRDVTKLADTATTLDELKALSA
ncbi:MAG: hypothetical protein F2774_08215 [Actinobacteria bacterium]|nr:hypothetical protein [Actinomycetota bacterium]